MVNHFSATPTLRDVARIAFRFRLRALLLFSAILLVTLAYVTLAPREYSSESRIFVRLGRESVSLDPTATMNSTISLNESRDSEINSMVEILNSRALAEDIVDQLGPEMILEPQTISDELEVAGAGGSSFSLLDKPRDFLFGCLAAIHLVDPVDARDRAVTTFMQSLAIEVGKNSTGTRTGSNVITLSYVSHTPEQAQHILSTLVTAYHDKHVDAHRTSGSLEFFVEQSALLDANLEERIEELRDAKNACNLTSIEDRRKALEEQRREAETRIRSTRGELAAAQAQVAALETTLAEMPERTVTQSIEGFPNQAADSMRDTLYQLEIREQDLLSRLTPDHPQVVAVQRQVQEALSILNEQERQRMQQTTGLNPTYQPLELELLRQQVSVASYQAQLVELQDQQQVLLAALQQLNTDEVTIGRLEREVALLESSYHEYAVNLEQSRIDHALEAERISNLSIVQPASISSDPIRPAKGAILALGLFLAVGAAVGLVLISYRLDQSFQTPDQLDREVDVPVWGSIAYQPRSILPIP